MSFIDNTLLATNCFRSSYQSVETVNLYRKIHINSQSTRTDYFYLVNKMAITALDACSTIFSSMKLSSSSSDLKTVFNLMESSCRLIDICRGFYLLDEPGIAIILNILKIQRHAFDLLKIIDGTQDSRLKYVSLGYALADTALRIYSVGAHRVAIKNQIAQLLTYFTLHISPKVDYVARGIGHALCSIKLFVFGMGSLYAMQDMTENRIRFSLSIPSILLFYSTVVVTRQAINEIATFFGIQSSTKAEIAKWSITLVSSTILSVGASVGFGLTQSVTGVFRKIFPVFFLGVLMTAIGVISFIGLNKIFKDLGFTLDSSNMLSVSISGILIVPLPAALTLGFGVSSSQFQVAGNIPIAVFSGFSLAFLHLTAKKIASLIAKGPMSWNQIKNSLISPYG